MTEIRLKTWADALGGKVPTSATLTITYSSARSAGSDVTLPRAITVLLTNGVPVTPIVVDPTPDDGYATVQITTGGNLKAITRTVAIPDVPTVDWADLVNVNPATFQPVPPVKAASDGLVAALVADPESLTRSRLDAAISTDTKAKLSRTRLDVAGEAMAARLELGSGNFSTVLLGDSTGNDPNEWYRLFVLGIAARFPALHVESRQWDDVAQAYLPAAVLQVGTGYVPPGLVTTVSDTFTRTDTELVGDVPNVGNAWTGATGFWATNGSQLVCKGASGVVVSSGGQTGDMTAKATGVSINTSAATTAKQFQLYAKYLSSNNHLFAFVSVSATGVVTWGLYKRIANVATLIYNGNSAGLGLTANAVNTFDMSIAVSGLDVALTANGVTVHATLLQSDADALATASSIGVGSASGASAAGITVEAVTLSVQSQGSGQKFTAYNGSMPGSTLAYQQARLALIVPTQFDIAFLSSSHNYGAGAPAAYLAAVNQIVADITTAWPLTKFVYGSQNPEFAPITTDAAHTARIVAGRERALSAGWGYLPIMEAFLALPDKGLSMINTDGLHPVPAGSIFWAAVVTEWLTSKFFQV